MKSRGVEIRTVRPYERAGLGVETNTVERLELAQRPKQRTPKDGLEIDDLFRPVGERHRQGVGTGDFEPCDSMDGVFQGLT